MFRTRDFILFLVVTVFLVVSIGTALMRDVTDSLLEVPVIQFNQTAESDFTAETAELPSLSRSEKLAEMRQRIAASSQVTISEPEPTLKEEEEIETEPKTELGGIKNCPDYSLFAGQWFPQGIIIEVQEGARLVYREVLAEQLLSSDTATSGTNLPQTVEPFVLLQLPAFPLITPVSNCIASDVVGIAKDGSLIRNTNANVYNIFGEETLLGYALDGYPIFGASDTKVDACGGANITGQYGYYISIEREQVLNCFSARPLTL